MDLKKNILEKNLRVGVIGLGYVGLPLSVAIANKGFSVVGIDIDRKKINSLKDKKSYIEDVANGEIAAIISNKSFSPSSDFSLVKQVDIVLVCVPTPLDEHNIPYTGFIEAASKAITPYLKKGQLIILESTTYPGCTDELVKPLLEESGLSAGKDFFLAFSPERVDPGNTQYPITKVPKVVGGLNRESGELAKTFYDQFIVSTFLVSSLRAAEMSKLLENVFRLVNISFINELKLLCEKMGIDIWEVIEAAKTKPYGFMPFYPGPGVGGHCIPEDPFYLSWKAREYGFYPRFIELAGEINEMMPHSVVTRIIWLLNNEKKPLNGASVLVLGVAYKKDIGDMRKSPATKILWDLLRKKALLSYHDPFVPHITIGKEKYVSIPLVDKALERADLVVILTDHSSIDYQHVAEKAKLVLDIRNAIKKPYPHVVK